MRIFAVHLLNDFSGSPKVLSQLIKGWVRNGHKVTLVTNQASKGFLTDIQPSHTIFHHYRFVENKFVRFLLLFYYQFLLGIQLYKTIEKQDILYVNTILPFGAAIAGKMKGCKVVYHIHETSIKPWLLKRFLFSIAQFTATEVVYVSKYLAKKEPLRCTTHVLYNALPDGFSPTEEDFTFPIFERRVLMICSLKIYKGILEFKQLAVLLPHFSFRLVVNANQTEIDTFFGQDIPKNLQIFPVQEDVRPFYDWTNIVLNLSHTNGWIETFGLTAIEAMAYGKPLIVPPVGGIAELVEDGVNGFKIDSKELDAIVKKFEAWDTIPHLFQHMSKQARQMSFSYEETPFVKKSIEILGSP